MTCASGDVDAFTAALIIQLNRQQQGYEYLTTNDITITNKGNPLVVNDIVTNANLTLKIDASGTSLGFTGTANITVKLTVS